MLYNIDMLCKARNEAIKLYDDYSLIASEAKNKAKNKTSGKGHKTLTPNKIMLLSKCAKGGYKKIKIH